MWHTLQRLSLGVFLILLASAILLLSEAPRKPRQQQGPQGPGASSEPARVVRVAIFQMASQPIIDEGSAGVLLSLKDAGFVDGQSMKLKRYNAEGDIATANAIAQELANGEFDLVITLTTGALQAMANANKQRKVPHVFGLVSDPVKAGVGIGAEPLDHPDHLVGIGTFPPVDQALELARKLNPKLSRVGLGWNPAEINSEVCTLLARKVCTQLKIELVEANVENTAAVKEAVASLIDKRVDALLVGGDVTMLGAMDVVAKAASDAHIPSFTCLPGNAAKGALFDVGANYYEVGRTTGRVAARVLNGEAIAKIPVEIAIPPKLFINTLVQKDLTDDWKIPAELIKQADSWIDETGRHDKQAAIAATSEPATTQQSKPVGKLWQLRILGYITSPDVDEAEHGLREGLKKSGLVEGRDYAVKMMNAQGDMSTLNSLVDAAIADNADLLLTISTSALQTASQRTKSIPIVFTMVSNPFAAGVGKSETDHLPNVTGAFGANDVKRMLPIIRQVMPNAKKLGSLYVPNEVNSVYSFELLRDECKTAGYELLSKGVNAGTEVLDATQSLCDQQPDAICLANSNLTGATFPTVAQVVTKAKLPIFAFLGSTASQGAMVVLTRDYYDMGFDSAQLAAKVIRGESPAKLPFHPSTTSKLILNLERARQYGIQLPQSLIDQADKVLEK